jgi:hypothetical protein
VKSIKYRILSYKKLFKDEYQYFIQIKKLCLFWVYVREDYFELSALYRRVKVIKEFKNMEDAIKYLEWKYSGKNLIRVL